MIVCAPICHSFVRRGKDDLAARFDARAAPNFHLPESGNVSLFGTRGRTVDKLNKYEGINQILGTWR